MINITKTTTSIGMPKANFELSGVLTKTTYLVFLIETTQSAGGNNNAGAVTVFTGEHIFGAGKTINIYGSRGTYMIHHKMILYGAKPFSPPFQVAESPTVPFGHDPANPFGSKMWLYKDFATSPFDNYELELPIADGKINVYVLQFYNTLTKPRLTSYQTCDATEDSIRLFSFDRTTNSSF